jgi:hypothetical protein
LRLFTFLILSLNVLSTEALPQGLNQTANLQSHWLINLDGNFIAADNQKTKSIYFWIDARKEKGNKLFIKGKYRFSVFVNSKCVLTKIGSAKISIDSLAKLSSHQLFVGVYSPQGIQHLESSIERSQPSNSLELVLRKGNYFLSFTIIASIILLISFILFLRTNPTLTFDYLDVNKLFSFQDRDESTLTLRIGSSVNLLIYFFGSLFLALMLLISFHLMGNLVSLSQQFPITSVLQGFWQWILLTLIIFSLLMAKLLWVVLMSALFGFRDTVRIQFFNFVRVILTGMCLLSVISITYFIIGVREPLYYFHSLTILSIVFILGLIAIYFKLVARMPFHFFHLFSYLCITEIIPLMVLIKVFFY